MKRLPIVSVLLGLAFFIAVVAAANFYLDRNQERAQRIQIEGQLQKITLAKESLEKERDELLKAKQSLEQQAADASRNAKALADQLAQEKRSLETMTADLVQSRKEASQSKSQLDASQQEKEALTTEVAKAKQSYQALSNELITLRQAKEALEKRVKEMLTARVKEAEQIVVTPPASAAAAAVEPKAGSAEGKILVVNREFNFVVVNLGSKDGIKPGARFAVFRGDKKIGTVEAERIYEGMTASNVLEEEKKAQIKEGDSVRPIS